MFYYICLQLIKIQRLTQTNMQKSEQENAQTLVDKINDQLICPISHQVMKDPVSIQSGHTFDRASIQMWFNRNRERAINPLTGKNLNSTKLYPNICVRNIINKLPDLRKRMQKQQKNYEDLLQTVIVLENLWNTQTPNGVPDILRQKQKLQAEKEQLKTININEKIQYQRKLLEKQAKILRLQHHLKYETNNCNNLKRQLSLTKRQVEEKRQRQNKSEKIQLDQKQIQKSLNDTQIVNLKRLRVEQTKQNQKIEEGEQYQLSQIDPKKNISQVLNRPPKYPNCQRDPSPSKSQEGRQVLKNKLQKQQFLKLPPKIRMNPEQKQQVIKQKQKKSIPLAEQMKQKKQQRTNKVISTLQKAIKNVSKSKQKLKKR